MPDEITYRGIRSGDGWLTRGPMTLAEAQELVESHLRGANLKRSYWLEEEGDHLTANFYDRDQPRSQGVPGGADFPKDQMWRSIGRSHSDKRKEFPNP